MRRMNFFRVAVATMVLGACATTPPMGAAEIGADVAALADDAMEGRATGAPGYDRAAAYVAARMTKIGLTPAASGDWFQEITLRTATPDQSAARFSLTQSDEKNAEMMLANDVDYVARRTYRVDGYDVAAPLVFAGYGIVAREDGVDDYAGLDVKGKIVVLFTGAPPTMNGEKREYYADGESKTATAQAQGAIGVLYIGTRERQARLDWPSFAKDARSAGMTYLDPDGLPHVAAPGIAVIAYLSDSGAEKVFAGEAQTYAALQAIEAQGEGAPKGFSLSKWARLTGGSKLRHLSSANVIGVIEGADANLRDEVVLLTAHLDHIGIDRAAAAGEDAINNGAFDNASGVAVMLEVARAMLAGERPRRTVAFAALTGEETGLFGSGYLAANPAFGDRKIIANINIDMPVAFTALKDIVAIGGERTTIGDDAAAVAAEAGVTLSPNPMPEEDLFMRSDQFSFIEAGVPAVFLTPGFSGDKFKTFLKDHYHQPSDDISLPINYRALAKFSDITRRLAQRLADAPDAPRFVEGDFYGEIYAKPERATFKDPVQ